MDLLWGEKNFYEFNIPTYLIDPWATVPRDYPSLELLTSYGKIAVMAGIGETW